LKNSIGKASVMNLIMI